MSFFGAANNAGTERKTGTLFGSTTAPPGGLFGQTQQPQQQQQNANSSTLFGGGQNAGSTLFGGAQQQQQQQQSQQNLSNSLFGGRMQPAPSLPPLQAQQLQQSQHGLPKLRATAGESAFASTLDGQREKSVLEQMSVLERKWNPTDPDCAFQYYFYNQVKPEEAPFYGPQPHENDRKWEEALSKKPNPGAIPVLARGFEEIAARIQYQNLAVTGLQTRLHEINNALKVLKSSHELEIASRISEARRKHVVFTQRTLALASKVQILRNRGYAMDQTEEELKKKLVELERKTFDPVLAGRQEEIWARMSRVREHARILQEKTEQLGKAIEGEQNGNELSEEDQKQIDKILTDYDKQLAHLKKWIDDTQQEYEEWEKENKPAKAGR